MRCELTTLAKTGAVRGSKIEDVRSQFSDLAYLGTVHAQEIHKLNDFTHKMMEKTEELHNLVDNLIARQHVIET